MCMNNYWGKKLGISDLVHMDEASVIWEDLQIVCKLPIRHRFDNDLHQ